MGDVVEFPKPPAAPNPDEWLCRFDGDHLTVNVKYIVAHPERLASAVKYLINLVVLREKPRGVDGG